jgi:uncharacterized protein YecT (DUF1311 family)
MPSAALAFQNRSDDQACALERTPLTRCGEFAEYVKEDRILNANYKALMKGLGKVDTATLKSAQLQWLDWRLEKCNDVDEHAHCDNGICAGVAHDDCIVSLTRQRADELKRFANDPAAAVAAKFAFSRELK